jgi:branched-subunit amino acid transport protein
VSSAALWAVVLAGGVGCYLLKLAGLSVPASWVQGRWVTRMVEFVPAALLAALVAVQAATTGHRLVADGRLVGLAVAAVALALRAPFIVVLVCAGAAGALVAVLTG